MKARLTLLAVPLMIGVAFAQSTPGSAAEQSNPSTANQPSAKASNPPASASTQPAEMKTMTYKGTLVDLGCGAASQNTASTATPSENANSNANSNTANRAAGDTSSCAVSSSTSQFGLKTDGGQVYRFDMVGNQRAQDEFKNNKHWSSAASGNKPLRVKISGVLQGDKLIVSSIH